MNPDKARDIYMAERLADYTHEECVAADRYVRQWAMLELEVKMAQFQLPEYLASFVILMVKSHYGSVEVDELLNKLGCYPEWTEVKKS